MYLPRTLGRRIKKMLGKFPVVTITGPRQSGKTTLLRNEFPDYKYYNLERLDHREMIISDPSGFLRHAGEQIIFDEAQHIPELFSYIQVFSDERGSPGQYILSGSQSFVLNEKISQSLAGRALVSHLFPLDMTEVDLQDASLFRKIWQGFYPGVLLKGISPDDFYPSYIQTYVERDIRMIRSVENLQLFTRFLSLCAGRTGQILNLSSLANDTGISVNTAKAWLSLLEASFVIFLLHPYYRNFNKRLIKSPKIYFYDTGLVCSLLRIASPEMLLTHYLYGQLYENLVVAEIRKMIFHAGRVPHLYYWRESNGTEIDLIAETESGNALLLEIKGGESFSNDYLRNLKKIPWNESVPEKAVIYAGNTSTRLAGVEIVGWQDLPGWLKRFT